LPARTRYRFYTPFKRISLLTRCVGQWSGVQAARAKDDADQKKAIAAMIEAIKKAQKKEDE